MMAIRTYSKTGILQFLETIQNGCTFCMAEILLKRPKSEIKEILDGLRFYRLIVSDNGIYYPVWNNIKLWKRYGWEYQTLAKDAKARAKINYDLGLDDE